MPYNYPNLSSKTSHTSPFTIVFTMAGSSIAGSFINAVVMTSVISAGNHALFAGSRLMYSLAVNRHAPRFLGTLDRQSVPWVAVLTTASISGLCFGASYIGAGQLWTWLQNIVGVSNQLSWIAIGFASLRFRAAIRKRGLEHLLPFKNWTYPYGPIISVMLNCVLVLVQGWSSFAPWSPVDFVSFYVEIPVMIVMFVVWKIVKKTKFVRLGEMNLVTDRFDQGMNAEEREEALARAKFGSGLKGKRGGWREKIKGIATWLFF